MGHGARIHFPKSMADHLLDVAIPDVVDYAADAILFESRRFQYQRQAESRSNRQRHLLWIVFVHLRCSIDLYRIATGRLVGLAQIEGNCLIGIEYVGFILTRATPGYDTTVIRSRFE